MCSPQGEQVFHLPQASLCQREVWRECKYKGVAKLCFASPFGRKKATAK